MSHQILSEIQNPGGVAHCNSRSIFLACKRLALSKYHENAMHYLFLKVPDFLQQHCGNQREKGNTAEHRKDSSAKPTRATPPPSPHPCANIPSHWEQPLRSLTQRRGTVVLYWCPVPCDPILGAHPGVRHVTFPLADIFPRLGQD